MNHLHFSPLPFYFILPNWFKNKLKKGKLKNASDEDIINYLNNSKEGQRILSGMAFRIPTHALSSIERFKVKAFLPQYVGHIVTGKQIGRAHV